MRKKWITVSVLLLLCIAVGFSIWYHQPIHKTVSMTVCTTSGETVKLDIDINVHRRFFKESIIRGSVTLDGVKYLDNWTSFPANEMAKVLPTTPSWMWFCKDVGPRTDIDAYAEKFQDAIWLLNDDELRFEHVCVTRNNVDYFGPAETAAEAKALAELLHVYVAED